MLKPVIFSALFIVSLFPAAGQTTKHPGIDLYKQKNYARAIDSLKEATKSREHKEDPEIWNYLGLAYLSDDEPRKAAKAFERSTDLDPSNPIYHTNLAWAQMRAREPGKAIKSADIAVRLGPDNPVAHEVRANIRFLQRNFDGAKADADRFLEIDLRIPEPTSFK